METPLRSLLAALGLVALAGCNDSRSPTVTGPGLPVLPPDASPPPPPASRPRENGPVRGTPAPVTLGAEATATVEEDDPRCFQNWDATGRCEQFEVTMPADGILVATLTLPQPDRGIWTPEIFLVAPNGDWLPHEFGSPTTSVRMAAARGQAYLIVVMSYGPFPDALRVRVEAER
jgi:hypothetical protein